jgi:hypothetical protein
LSAGVPVNEYGGYYTKEVHESSERSRYGGGTTARWRGKESLYVAPDGNVMAVEVATTPAFHRGAATPVFKLPARAMLNPSLFDGYTFIP